jgi:diguanylate cyclase (GGDEF)-like protein
VVEDNPGFQRLLQRRLEQYELDVLTASDGEEALKILEEHDVELVLSDWMMPRLDGVGLCRAMRTNKRLRSIYFILLSSRTETDEKVFGLEQGADDYLEKSCATEELIARVRGGLRIRKLHHALQERACTDDLTGLANRGRFFDRLEEELDRIERYSGDLCLVMLDVDNLKDVNDEHGHLAGDAVIRHVAHGIQRNCRRSDLAARYGGDEFAVLFINASATDVALVMERMALDIASLPVRCEDATLSVGVSFGLMNVSGKNQFDSADDVIRAADRRLYVMKRRRVSAAVSR